MIILIKTYMKIKTRLFFTKHSVEQHQQLSISQHDNYFIEKTKNTDSKTINRATQ